MRRFVEGALIGAAIATVVTGGINVTGLAGESGHAVRDIHCAPVSVKMPCLQPGRG